ncbi:hypothetical protein [Nostoc commune]|uniref:hypothetical protein n=1 Tax=Nostoc commune TaxID=1178 RepID=UPI0018C57173|nr:hypothetical protein [Nostoc commune]MBG1262745.1 hypothetical protein [Nostoc commune BAE]
MSVKSLVKPHPNPLLGKEREQEWLICGLILIILSFAIAPMIYNQSEFDLQATGLIKCHTDWFDNIWHYL